MPYVINVTCPHNDSLHDYDTWDETRGCYAVATLREAAIQANSEAANLLELAGVYEYRHGQPTDDPWVLAWRRAGRVTHAGDSILFPDGHAIAVVSLDYDELLAITGQPRLAPGDPVAEYNAQQR